MTTTIDRPLDKLIQTMSSPSLLHAITSRVIESLRAMLESRRDIDLAVLFGSAATGTMRRGSDIDLALRWTGTEPGDKNSFFAELERALGRPVDVIDLALAPPQLRFEIARNGVLLVERTKGEWSEAKARAFLDWWDFRPIAERVNRAAIERLAGSTLDGSR